MTEPLARLGANVIGLDANTDLIEKAKVHSKNENLKVQYICSTVEDFALQNGERFDAIVASEILEHITKKDEFLKACLQCLKSGGSIFVTTINKTFVAKVFGVYLAERLFKFLPDGTHQHEKFIEPHKLERMLEDRKYKFFLNFGLSQFL